jgi:hypothetical protein
MLQRLISNMRVKSSKLKVKSYSLKLKVLTFAFCVMILHFALCTLFLPKAYAEGTSLKMQPSNLQIRVTSPADVRAPFTLTNVSEAPVSLTILLKRFRDAGDSTGKVIYSNSKFITEANTDSFLKNVQVIDDTVAITQLTLGPKQKKNLVLRVPLPQDASTSSGQDHYFSVVFLDQAPQEEAEVEEDTTLSQVQTGISLPVLISVNQTGDQRAFLSQFSAPFVIESGPVPFTVLVKNPGEHFIEAQGMILIKNMFGQTVGKIELPKTNILSGSTRFMTVDPQQKASGNNTQSFWSEEFLLGFYTATITLATSPGQSLYTRSIHFFAFPAIGFTIIFLSILIIIFFILRVRKKLSQG